MVQLVRHTAFSAHAPCSQRVRTTIVFPGHRICNLVPAHLSARLRCRSTVPNQPAPQKETLSDGEEFVGIPPEDDVEVPGTYFDALNPNTKLGKAVRAAVDELNHLNAMEMETLQQADALLKKMGLKTSILQAPAPVQPPEDSEDPK